MRLLANTSKKWLGSNASDICCSFSRQFIAIDAVTLPPCDPTSLPLPHQEQRQAEEERICKEKEMDYLAPFLARIGDPPTLTKAQMEEVEQVGEDSPC